MSRIVQASSLLIALLLVGCGFHLRKSVALPPSMQQIHLTVSGSGDLQRKLARALRNSGVEVSETSGSGIAELRIPSARFDTERLNLSGAARITEYSVRYDVSVSVSDGDGNVLLPQQQIQMSREYSYDATNAVGDDTEVEQIQQSLVDDMVQSIMFRLQAAARHVDEAAAASTPTPGAASSVPPPPATPAPATSTD